MARNPGNRVTQEIWDKLIEAYREDPGNHSHASRHALVKRITAKRAYEIGYPSRPWAIKPIKQLILEDIELARARIQLDNERADLEDDQADLEAERDREASRQHAITAKQQEGQLVASARAGAILGLAAAVKVASGLQKAMMRLGTELENMADPTTKLTPKEVGNLSSIMRRYSSTLRELNAAGQLAMEMERLRMGEPSSIIGVMTDLDTMPMAELAKMAGYQDKILRRAQERGLVLLDGGLGKASEPSK